MGNGSRWRRSWVTPSGKIPFACWCSSRERPNFVVNRSASVEDEGVTDDMAPPRLGAGGGDGGRINPRGAGGKGLPGKRQTPGNARGQGSRSLPGRARPNVD